MPGCYILYSEKLNKFYIGATHDDVLTRIKKHNEGVYGNHRFTAIADDWELFLFLATEDYPHAVRMERKVKSMKSSTYIRNLLKYPELREKLFLQTKQST